MVDPGTTTLPEPRGVFIGNNLLKIFKDKIFVKGRNRAAIVGLPGSGKTRLSLELARNLRSVDGFSVFWIRAESEETFEQSYRQIGDVLVLPEEQRSNEAGSKGAFTAANGSESSAAAKGGDTTSELNLSQDQAPMKPKSLNEIKRHLEETGPWVIIVDNLDNEKALFGSQRFFDMIPTCNDRNSIIFTGRDKRPLRDLVPSDGIFHLDGLFPEDAEKLLIRKSQDSQAKREDVTRLTAALFYSPLAINQAASHIARYNLTIRDYLETYDRNQEDQSKMFGQSNGRVSKELPAMKVWWLSFEKLKENDELAVHFLQLMSMFSTRDIPQRLLPRECEEADFLKAVRALEALSFIEQHTHRKLYDIDPLIQMAVRSHLRSTDQFERYYLLAIEIASKLFPETYDDANDLETASLLLPHARELLHHGECKALSPTRMDIGTLASRVSLFLREQGSNETAVHYARLAVELMTTHSGMDDSRTLKAVSDLSVCLRRAGALEEAESKANEVFHKRTLELGPSHSDTLASMNNLANILYNRGKLREAEDLYRRTVTMREETLGADHSDTLKSLDNLSVTLQKLGKLEEAEIICRRVLARREQYLDAGDLSILTSKSNLGTILQLQKRWEESWELHTAALMGRENILGRKHPETINSYANLAGILQSQQQFESAAVMAQVVLDLRTVVLGKRHPDTIKAMRNMASLFHSMKKWREAERMSTQAFWLARSAFGEEHPDTRAAKNHTDSLRDWLRRHPEADSARSNSSANDVD